MAQFDLITHLRDKKTGRVIRRNPYTMRVVPGLGDSQVQLFERPVGSGNLFYKSGEPAGRWEAGKHLKDASHKEWNPPPSADQLLAAKLSAKDQRIAQLEAEMDAIKKEAKKGTVK